MPSTWTGSCRSRQHPRLLQYAHTHIRSILRKAENTSDLAASTARFASSVNTRRAAPVVMRGTSSRNTTSIHSGLKFGAEVSESSVVARARPKFLPVLVRASPRSGHRRGIGERPRIVESDYAICGHATGAVHRGRAADNTMPHPQSAGPR